MNNKNLIGIIVVLVIVFAWFAWPKNKQNNTVLSVSSGSAEAKELFVHAESLRKEGDTIKAKQVYQKILNEHPDFGDMEKMQKDLEVMNMEILFSNKETEKTVLHEVQSGDTLGKLAKQYGTTIELIKRSNNLKSNVIRIGQRLRIWKGVFNVFVDKSQNILLLKDEENVFKVYSVSTGKNNSTPVGEFTIISKLTDPVWFNRGAIVSPESPENALGSRWLGFDISGYGIHGTIEPETIGRQATAGCVRMRNEDAEELYSVLPMGTKVVIVD